MDDDMTNVVAGADLGPDIIKLLNDLDGEQAKALVLALVLALKSHTGQMDADTMLKWVHGALIKLVELKKAFEPKIIQPDKPKLIL